MGMEWARSCRPLIPVRAVKDEAQAIQLDPKTHYVLIQGKNVTLTLPPL